MYLQAKHKDYTVRSYEEFMTRKQSTTYVNFATTILKIIIQNNKQSHEQ